MLIELLITAQVSLLMHHMITQDLGCQTATVDRQAMTLTWKAEPSPQTILVDLVYAPERPQQWTLTKYEVIVKRPTGGNVFLNAGVTPSTKFTASAGVGEYCSVVNAIGNWRYTPFVRRETPLQIMEPRVYPVGRHTISWPASKNPIDGYRLYVSSDAAFLGNPVLSNETAAPINTFYVARPDITWHVALTEVTLDVARLPAPIDPKLRKTEDVR